MQLSSNFVSFPSTAHVFFKLGQLIILLIVFAFVDTHLYLEKF